MPDSWLFFNACGHPFGLHVATPTVQTERQAWNAFYDTEKQRCAAEDRGVTCRRVDHETYRAQWAQLLRDGCDCEPAPVAESKPYATGTCSVCGRENTRLLKDGTVGLHHDPRKKYNRVSGPRCNGWGKLPKEAGES